MNKKAVPSGENPENEVEIDLNDDGEEIQAKDLNLSLSYLDKIQEFIRRNELAEAQTVYYLYKFDNPVSGNQKAFIAKFQDVDTPDEDQIGKKFGSGRYLVVMAISPCEKAPKGAMRAYPIRIHQFYDTLKAEPQVHQVTPQTTIIQQPQSNFSDILEMIGKIISIMSPLLAQKQQQAPDMTALLLNTYQTTNEVLKQSMLENVKVNSELQKKLLSAESGEDMEVDTEEETPSLLEQLKPLMIEWLPKLIGDNQQSKAVQGLVKAAPQFKQIVNNKAEFKSLVSYLDKTQGKEITDKILANLKLKRV